MRAHTHAPPIKRQLTPRKIKEKVITDVCRQALNGRHVAVLDLGRVYDDAGAAYEYGGADAAAIAAIHAVNAVAVAEPIAGKQYFQP